MGIASKGPRIVLRELRRGCTVSGGRSSSMGEVTSVRVVLVHGRGDLGAGRPRPWARIDRELVFRELSGIDSAVTGFDPNTDHMETDGNVFESAHSFTCLPSHF
ncbi:hypothetical protein DY000_02031401 [Brassica cretica]|uniref:Uncharacterized protein n=1 Tax=Brassica cretica TaxID=69181 RepID=A0ABQ7DQK9_BRACR|nr:hypothetical protein DY000_02031401 [Brassica cretica]